MRLTSFPDGASLLTDSGMARTDESDQADQAGIRGAQPALVAQARGTLRRQMSQRLRPSSRCRGGLRWRRLCT